MAEATQERKLLGVGSSAWFGAASVGDIGLLLQTDSLRRRK
jgi:hypothetical protein